MKRFFALICMLLFLGGLGLASAAELLLNTGFETWTAGLPDNWNTTGSPSGITLTEETGTIHGGSKSVKAVWTTIDNPWFQQALSVNAGANYSYSAWILDNDTGGRARIYIRFRDSGGSLTGSAPSSAYSADSPSWQELTIAETAAPVGAVTAEFQVRFYDITGWPGTATIYVDDASMQGVAGDLTPPSDKLIRVVDTDSIEITFTEDVDQATAETESNYSVNNAVGNPSNATRDAVNHAKVMLDFSAPLPTVPKLTITINGVKDLNNNPTSGLTADFLAGFRTPGEVDDINTPNGEQVYENTYVTVRGLVTATEFQDKNITLAGVASQDGIEARDSGIALSGVNRGDKIVVCGKLGQYYGMAQILASPLYYVVEQSGLSEPAAQVISITPVTNVDEGGVNAFSGEPYEGNLVEIKNVSIGNNLGGARTGGSPDSDGLFDGDCNYEISVTGATGILRIDTSTDIDGTAIPSQLVTLRGILMQYDTSTPFNAGYSIYPRDSNDIIAPILTAASAPWMLYE